MTTAAWSDSRIASGMRTQLAQLRERRAAGARTLGWKVGFGAPAALERFRIEAPLVGYLLESAILPSGSVVPVAGWTKPVAEPEIAVYMGRDLAAGATRDEARAAVAALGPCIELADLDRAPDEVEQILAGNIYQRHIILGPKDASRGGCNLDGLLARVHRSGAEIAATREPQALTGDYIDIVRHVADVLAGGGERLSAGHIIITGSITPPLFVTAGEDVRFNLEPVGEVSVRFT